MQLLIHRKQLEAIFETPAELDDYFLKRILGTP